MQAWHLKEQGWSQRQIAEALGVSDGGGSQAHMHTMQSSRWGKPRSRTEVQ